MHKSRRTGTIKALREFARPSMLQLHSPMPIVQPTAPTLNRTESTIGDDLVWILGEIAKTMWKQSSPNSFYLNQAANSLAASPCISLQTRGLLNLVACGALIKGYDETVTKVLGTVNEQKRRRLRGRYV